MRVLVYVYVHTDSNTFKSSFHSTVWISRNKTFQIIVSLPIKTVSCISTTVIAIAGSVSGTSLNTCPTSRNTSFMPPTSAPTTRVFSLSSSANYRYLVCFSLRFALMFTCCGHAISQTQIFFFVLKYQVCGLLEVADFRKPISKSHTNFAFAFSNTF